MRKLPQRLCATCLYRVGLGVSRISKRLYYSKKPLIWFLRTMPYYKSAEIKKAAYATQRGRHIARHSTRLRIYSKPIGPGLTKIKAVGGARKPIDKASVAARAKHRYHTDPQYMLRVRLRRRIRKMIGDGKAYKSSQSIIGCDWATFKAHMEGQFLRGMTWRNYGKWHIDHIVPCSTFDLTKPDQVERCFHYSNLRPLWAKDNLTKSDKIVFCQPELMVTIGHCYALAEAGAHTNSVCG